MILGLFEKSCVDLAFVRLSRPAKGSAEDEGRKSKRSQNASNTPTRNFSRHAIEDVCCSVCCSVLQRDASVLQVQCVAIEDVCLKANYTVNYKRTS